jgi:hypothetical protein
MLPSLAEQPQERKMGGGRLRAPHDRALCIMTTTLPWALAATASLQKTDHCIEGSAALLRRTAIL